MNMMNTDFKMSRNVSHFSDCLFVQNMHFENNVL